jgi:tetratricopeptide (TPR) repeat protein
MRLKLTILTVLVIVFSAIGQAQIESGSDDYQYALIEAVKQKNLGNFPEAIKLYKLVINEKYDVAIAHYELGIIYFIMNQPETAEIHLRNAFELDPSNYWYTGGYIDVLVANEKFRDAEKILRKVVRNNPEEVEYSFQLARLYSVLDQSRKAIKILDEIEREYGYSEKVTLLKASVYDNMGKYHLAKVEIEKVLDYFPESLQFRIVAAELSLKSGEEEEAAGYYKQVFDIDSTNIFALTNLTDYYRKKEDYSNSFFYMSKSFENPLIDSKRKLAIISFYSADEKYLNGYRHEIERLVEIYLDMYPKDADGKLVAVDFYINSKDYEKGYVVLNEYLKLKTSSYGIWMQAVLLANAAGLNNDLVDITGRALENFNDSADIVFFRSLGLYGLERYDEVVSELEQIDFEKYSNEEYMRTSYHVLAESYNHLKNFEESDRLYEMIIMNDPQDYISMNNYSYYLAERGEKLEKAKAISYLVVRDNPDNATFIDTYAWVLYKLEDYENAEKYIQEALIKGGDSDPEINEHAGDIMLALGSLVLAKKYYEKALILGGDQERLTGKINSIPDE